MVANTSEFIRTKKGALRFCEAPIGRRFSFTGNPLSLVNAYQKVSATRYRFIPTGEIATAHPWKAVWVKP